MDSLLTQLSNCWQRPLMNPCSSLWRSPSTCPAPYSHVGPAASWLLAGLAAAWCRARPFCARRPWGASARALLFTAGLLTALVLCSLLLRNPKMSSCASRRSAWTSVSWGIHLWPLYWKEVESLGPGLRQARQGFLVPSLGVSFFVLRSIKAHICFFSLLFIDRINKRR